MYSQRIKIFIAICSLLFLACIIRLAQMQLFPSSPVQVEIEKLKNIGAKTLNLSTVRGKILDREGRVLAIDEPTFWLNIDYMLSQYMDPNYLECRRLLAKQSNDPNNALYETNIEIQNKVEQVKEIMAMCAHFDITIPEIEQEIKNNNDKIWNVRKYCVWKNNYPDQTFEEALPDPNERLLKIYGFRTVEMYESFSLFELETSDDVFTAQFEFKDVDGIEVISKGKRHYPYGNIAAQTIGWVGGVPRETTLFQDDELMRYLSDEVCGRMNGVEYVCEPILRGRRGEVYLDIDQQLISRTEPRFGQDVIITIDIELQRKIENYLSDYELDGDSDPNIAEVVIDVESGDILAMVSLPNYDNNRTRYDFEELLDPNNILGRPLINRAINENYPPGSVAKPLILIAGMEANVVTSEEVISCPAHDPEKGWPKCWIWKQSHSGHDIMWGNNNNARNALKGSCNAYFSKVADSLESYVIQSWLYGFGYGHKVLQSPIVSYNPELSRNIRQSPGIISSENPTSSDLTLVEMTPIVQRDKKRFGIGQSNLRATPLQVANSMAVLARRGVYMDPRLYGIYLVPISEKIPLNISQHTMDTVYDGMYAVVNERNGTAYEQFSPSLNAFNEQGLKIYGKTGSTEDPENAWFAGFATDTSGRKLAFAVVVEGGQHGSSDAAPLIRDTLQFCIEAGYIGEK